MENEYSDSGRDNNRDNNHDTVHDNSRDDSHNDNIAGENVNDTAETIVLGTPGAQDQSNMPPQHNSGEPNRYGYPPLPGRGKETRFATRGFVAAVLVINLVISAAFGVGGIFIGRSLADGGANAGGGSSKNVNINYNEGNPVSADISGATDISGIAAMISDTVVEITTEAMATNSFFGQYVTKGAGSGVIVDNTGHIVTCAHVVDGATTINVKLSNGEIYSATLVGSDSKTDIAVIKIEPKDGSSLHAATIGNSDKLVVGQPVIAIGNPLGELGGTVTNGIISATSRPVQIDGQNYTLLQTNAAINPGNSGGGLFDIAGNLIGVVNAKSSGTGIEGLGFAIPSNSALDIAKQIIEKGFISGRPALGFMVFEIKDMQDIMQYPQYNKYIDDYGVYIASSESPDFHTGDRIIAINDTTVSTKANLKSLLAEFKVGETVTVTISRIDEIRNRSKIMHIDLMLRESQPQAKTDAETESK